MIMGMTAYTFFHVLISLGAVLFGLVVAFGFVSSSRQGGAAGLFLTLTAATDITGFLFPFHGITPAIIVGIINLFFVALAMAALYLFRLAGAWRWIYVVSSAVALWFNIFVLIVQSFQKIPALHALAPKGAELPFAVAQLAGLLLVIVLGFLGVRRFHPR